jgi:hypothetical protein
MPVEGNAAGPRALAAFSPRSGQSSMILILLVVMVFAGVAVFLLSFAQQLSQEDYMYAYTNNMWLALSRSDTGYSDMDCKLVSDALACAYYLGNPRCGGTGKTCLEVANGTLAYYLQRFSEEKGNLRYLLTFESWEMNQTTGRLEPHVSLVSGEPLRLRLGDEGLDKGTMKKWVVNENIIRGEYVLKARLVTAIA